MVKKKGQRKVSRVRGGTLGIPGLPSITMLGGFPSNTPVVKGKRISKLLKDDVSPSWDDAVKVFEENA